MPLGNSYTGRTALAAWPRILLECLVYGWSSPDAMRVPTSALFTTVG